MPGLRLCQICGISSRVWKWGKWGEGHGAFLDCVLVMVRF